MISVICNRAGVSLAVGGVYSVYWAAALALAVAAESTYLDDQLGVGMKRTDYEPGMLGFDPLGLDSKVTRNAEIWLGRVGMMAVVARAYVRSAGHTSRVAPAASMGTVSLRTGLCARKRLSLDFRSLKLTARAFCLKVCTLCLYTVT